MKPLVNSYFSLNLNDEQINKLDNYCQILLETNKVMNLVSQTDSHSIYIEHIIDSLSFNLISLQEYFSDCESLTVCDIGSGAGFPAIPISIMYPEIHCTLIESIGKKAHFLRNTSEHLNLKNNTVLNERIETIAHNDLHRGKYNIITARALAKMSTLLEYAMPLLDINGIFVAYKTEKVYEELKDLGKVLTLLGGEIVQTINYEMDKKTLKRTLIIVRKHSITSEKFPRKPGIPTKKPLGQKKTC